MRLGILTGGGDCPGRTVEPTVESLRGKLPRGGMPSAFDRLPGTRSDGVPLSVVRGGPRPVDPDFLETASVFSG